MSLTQFIHLPDVKDRLKPLQLEFPRRIDAALQCEPRSKRYIMVGTAFEYLFRFDTVLDDRTMLLNPMFGEASSLVRGSDADLISGDRLIDVKVTKHGRIKEEYLDQLLGYFLLARHHRCADKTFPEIKRIGIYFCRHGYLWVRDVTTWTEHPEFAAIEKWFFARAQDIRRDHCTAGRRAAKDVRINPAERSPRPSQRSSGAKESTASLLRG